MLTPTPTAKINRWNIHSRLQHRKVGSLRKSKKNIRAATTRATALF